MSRSLLLALSLCLASPGQPARTHEEVASGIRSRAQTRAFDVDRFVAMLDATADSLIDRNPGLGADYPIWVLPSQAYPEMYSRDSFWTLWGYGKGKFLEQYVDIFA